MTLRVAHLPLALVVLAACESSPTVTQAPPVAAEADAWAGGVVQMRSGGFRTAASVHVFLAGRSLKVDRVDDSTLVADLPDTNGTFSVTVDLDGVRVEAGDVRIHGHESSHALPHFDGNLLAWPPRQGTFVGGIGGILSGSRLYLVNPATGSTARFLDDSLFDGAYASPSAGAGPAGEPILILTGHSAASTDLVTRAVTTSRAWAVADTFFYRMLPWAMQRVYTRLAGGGWVQSFPDWLRLARRNGGGSTSVDLAYYAASRFAISSDGEFAVPVGGGIHAPDWVPILRSADIFSPTGLPHLRTNRAATFTPSGDTLYIQGGDPYSPSWPDTLFAVDARTGAFLGRVAGTRPYDDLVADRQRPWLYALTADSIAGGATLTVYDRRAMQVVAVQHASGAAPWDSRDGAAFLALDATGRRLHAVLASTLAGGSAPSIAFTFSLMP